MLKVTKVKPMFTALITTMNKYEDDVKTGVIFDASKSKGTLKEWQTVVEIGPNVRDINVGDKVMINPKRFATVNHKHNPNSLKNDIQQDTTSITYSFDVIEINGVPHLLLQDRDIDYVFEGEEVPDEKETTKFSASPLIVPDTQLIV